MDKEEKANEAGKKYFINIEGTEYPWAEPTITVAQIRTLGNIPSDQQVIEEDADGNERTLGDSDVITLKPGHRHGRAAKYKRGSAGA